VKARYGASYGASMEIVAAYGDAVKQAVQLSQRGRRGYPPVKAVSHDGRTFYVATFDVAGEDQSRVISYFTGPVVFSIKMQQKEMPSGEPAEPGASRRPEESLLKTVTRTLDLDNREPIQPPSGLYDEASVRAFWKSTSMYGPEGKGRLLYEENAPDLLPSDAPDSFSYRFAGLGGKMGGTSIGIALPLDWTTISPSRRGVGGIAFARSAEDFDTETVTISSSPISLKADDNVIIQASVPGRRGSGPSPASMIENLVDQAPLKEATVVREPTDTTLSGYDAVRATVRGQDADGRPARYRMFGVSVEGTTLMLAVLRPEAVSVETKEIIQTALNHLDLRKI
jgi:hypothetical protein